MFTQISLQRTRAIHIALACLAGSTVIASCDSGQDTPDDVPTVCFDRVSILEETATTSANASVGDLNGDGNLDIVLIKGRHWPAMNQILFGDGSGNFAAAADLGDVADRSYTGALADLDRDGDLDIVVSNDKPDRKLVYLNDGDGLFSESSTFGQAQWTTRNISVADINGDELPDVVVANRGPLEDQSPNYVCLNLGNGEFENDCRPFTDEPATSFTPVDLDGNGWVDLVVPHRDGGQGHVYMAQTPRGDRFEARPFGPEQSAMRATAVADLNLDGLMDIVAIHPGNSPGGDTDPDAKRTVRGVVVYYGRGDNVFSEGHVIDDAQRVPYALLISDLNLDGAVDIIVGYVEATSSVYLNLQHDNRFRRIDLGDDDGAAYGFAVGDLDENGQPDIVVAKSDALNRVFFGSCVAGQ